MNNIITIEKLEKTYVSKGENLTILKDLDLTVPQGKKIIIVGESGSGKSTLAKILMQENRYAEAIEQISDAIMDNPDLADLHCILATLHVKIGNKEEAISEYKLALSDLSNLKAPADKIKQELNRLINS